MYKVGEYVVKVNNGVCRIEDIVEMKLMSPDLKKYYLLVPLDNKTAKVYVPVDGKNDNVRYVMTGQEAQDFIERIPSIEVAWIESDKIREQEYKTAIRSGSPDSLISIIKNIYIRNLERYEQGKKVTTVDDRYNKMAENILYSELAFALDQDRQKIVEEVSKRIGV